MEFDFLLSLTLFLVSSVSLLLFLRFEKRLEEFSSGQQLRVRDVVLIVAMMAVMVVVVVLIPGGVLQILFLFSASSLLFMLTYLIVPKVLVAVLPPALLVGLYFLYWNLFFMDLFAILLVVSAILYIGRIFTWKTTLAFAALLTANDIIQVFGTGYMVDVAKKASGLALPMMIVIPSFPSPGLIALGLGDLLLSGLFVIQTAQRWGKHYGLISCASTAAGLMIGEFIILNTPYSFLPATVFVTLGWLAAFGYIQLKAQKWSKNPVPSD
jgi:presenilin-like A22 family membrane protease